jgi:ubiquinone/menaquinone biosynthesis C-methylase UbiE
MIDKSDNYKEKSKNTFNRKSKEFYKTPEGRVSKKTYSALIKKLNDKPFESLLDVGCGTGKVLSLIKDKFNAKVSGIDLSEGMIRKSKELLGEGADLKVGDSENLLWNDDTFDVIVCNESFHHYPNPIAVLKEMKRVLKANGRVIIADPWLPNPIRFLTNILLPLLNSGDVKIYSVDEMKKMLESCGFTSVNIENSSYYFIATAIVKN